MSAPIFAIVDAPPMQRNIRSMQQRMYTLAQALRLRRKVCQLSILTALARGEQKETYP